MPSSFITSQITPAGVRPARRARSTLASVWPVRSSTPPSLARSGNMWPGTTMSRGPESGSIATWIVWARSWAEIPVLTPSAASIVTVKAVCSGASFLAAIRLRPSCSQRSAVSARQIRPRASLAMKLIASGVANWAAITRSPSFSRSSPSQTTTIRPAADLLDRLLDRRERALARLGSRVRLSSASRSSGSRLLLSARMVPPTAPRTSPRRRTRRSACRPRLGLAEVRPLEGLGDQRDLDPVLAQVGDREADAVEARSSPARPRSAAAPGRGRRGGGGRSRPPRPRRPRRRRRRGPGRCGRRAGRRPSAPARG